MPGPSLPNPPYGGNLGLGAPGGRSPTSATSYSPPTLGPSLPITADAAHTLSSHSTKVKGQRLHSAKPTRQDCFGLTSI